MIYNIDVPRFGRIFSVPCAAAERFMSAADGNYYKVLLCVLCSDGSVVDSAEIAARANVDTVVAEDALLFWTSQGIISARPDGQAAAVPVPAAAPVMTAAIPAAAPVMQPVMQPVVQQVQPVQAAGTATAPAAPSKKPKKPKAEIKYSPSEIAKIIESDPETAQLFDQVQRVFGRLLKPSESTGFINLIEYYGFSPPSILILTQFAHDLGKNSIAYIETVAEDWFVKGITEYADIEREISRLTEQNRVNSKIKAILGIEGPTTKEQGEYFENWCSWGFSVEMIGLAGEICRNKKSRNELPYINGILRRWRDNSLMTIRAVLEHDKQYAAKKAELQAKYGKDGNSETSTIDNDKWYELADSFDPWAEIGEDADIEGVD